MIEYLKRMARYNQWMNRKLYDKVQQLSAEAIGEYRGAFFDSILGTLNHIMVTDLLWLHRYTSNKSCSDALAAVDDFPMPASLRDIIYDDIQQLADSREALDQLILSFSETWDEMMLTELVRYRSMDDEMQVRSLGELLQHQFNHQTHHRGQVTTLLFQAGIDPEVTDLLAMMMEEH